MRILDEINDKEACGRGEPCPEPSGIGFSYILLMIYMVLVNVLLLNLLIAMFRYILRILWKILVKAIFATFLCILAQPFSWCKKIRTKYGLNF